MSYIGLDIGTSGCKGALISGSGELLAAAGRSYPFVKPEKGWVELDPEVVWKAVCEVLRELSAYPDPPKALAVSGIGEAFLLLDKTGRPLYNFITYLDGRGAEEAAEVEAAVGSGTLYGITGLVAGPAFSLNKLLWLRKHRPDLFSGAQHIVFHNEYFAWRLTGVRKTDSTTAARSWMFDIERGSWSDTILKAFHLNSSLLSEVVRPGAPIGAITEDAARQTGLPRDIMIYAGCHDQIAAALGAGLLDDGDVILGEGSSESINMVSSFQMGERAEELLAHEFCVGPYIQPGKKILMMGTGCFGTALRWYAEQIECELFNQNPDHIYDLLNESCPDANEVMFFPNLSRTGFQASTIGEPGGFLGITLDTTKPEMYRAVLEGLHFGSRRNMEAYEALGLSVRSITAAGAMTKSDLAMQMKADILNREISTSANPNAGIMGLAILCAEACGDCVDYEEAVRLFSGKGKQFVPCRSYEERYARYSAMREVLRTGLKALHSDSLCG